MKTPKSKPFANRKEGSALIGALIICLMFSVMVASYMKLSWSEYKLSHRTYDMQSAEAGLEEAMVSVISGNWTGWTTVTGGRFKEIAGISYADGRTGRVRVYAKGSPATIAAEGSMLRADGSEITKQVRVDLRRSGFFMNGMTAKQEIIFNGNGVLIDSYDSRLGAYTEASNFNRFDTGSVASLLVTNNAVSVNNADIFGFVATGGSQPQVGSNGFISSYDYFNSGMPSGKVEPGRVATDFYAELPNANPPSMVNPITQINFSGNTATIGSAVATVPTYYHIQNAGFSMSGQKKLVIDGPVVLVVDRNFSMSGQTEIRVTTNGSLKLYAGESISISGNGAVNQTSQPKNLQIYGTMNNGGQQSVSISGNGSFFGIVYAPNGNVHMNGGGNSGAYFGAIVGNQITLNGHWPFHYDISLKDLDNDGKFKISTWRELRENGEKLDFSQPSSLSASL